MPVSFFKFWVYLPPQMQGRTRLLRSRTGQSAIMTGCRVYVWGLGSRVEGVPYLEVIFEETEICF